MPQDANDYNVTSVINHKDIPLKLRDLFSQVKMGETISSNSFFEEYKSILLQRYDKQSSAKRAITLVIRKASALDAIQRVDDKFIPDGFRELRTVSYWQSQLRGNRQKNIKGKQSTKGQYLYQLWNFNKWLTERVFSINSLQVSTDNSFVQKIQKTSFENVEMLLEILEKPFADQKNVTRIIKQFLLDETNSNLKASSITFIKCAITSYFTKNEHEINISFNSKSTHDNTVDLEQSMSISEFMDFLTTGKPSVAEKALFLCKFHRGLDVSTFADRFNYESWGQIVQWFGSENYNSWDLEKCPVPISLTRVKTDYKHLGFLERDAIYQLQKYLDYRKTKTGQSMQEEEPLFLNKFGRPITSTWISNSFSRIAERAGIQKFIKINGRKQFKMDSHELRDLLKSTLIDSGCRIDVADHVIGHKPKDSYEKQSTLYPETLRKEYAKASKRLNIFTKFSNVVSGKDDADELRLELKEKLSEMEKIKQSRLDDEARQYRHEKTSLEQARQMRLLQDTVNELKKEIRSSKQSEKSLEFCCVECEMVHCEKQCPACGSKMRRIYEEKIQN